VSLLAAVGRPVVIGGHWLLLLAGLAYGALAEALSAPAWRRPVCAEFLRSLRAAALGGLPAMLVTAALIGLAMVYQALYWLEAAGERDLVGQVLAVVLVRELAPLLVGLILIGRTGTASLIELGAIRAGGPYQALEAMGIDPFRFLVMPRSLALALAGFALTMLFLAVALLTGFLAGSALGAVHLTLYDFLDEVLHAMGPGTYALVPLKSLAIGFAVGLVCCATALRSADAAADMARLMPRGFLRAVLATLLINGGFSVLL
jgi:phospholipid/cholesterol/gamma-HCH transport system permease protein